MENRRSGNGGEAFRRRALPRPVQMLAFIILQIPKGKGMEPLPQADKARGGVIGVGAVGIHRKLPVYPREKRLA